MHPYASYLPAAPSAPAPYPAPSAQPNIALANAIRYASQQELPKLVERAMKSGATLNSADCYECNALVIAVRANRPWAISVLMARGAVIPDTPSNGINLLMEACRDGHDVMAEALVDVARIDVHAQDSSGKTALHYAVLSQLDEVVPLLLNFGAKPDIPAAYLTADEWLLIFGHDLPQIGDSVTPLMIATTTGNEAIVATLLDAKADPRQGSCSPLIIAACKQHTAIFNLLLGGGANLQTCRIVDGRRGLAACVASRMPVAFLSKLIPQHDFQRDSGNIHSPLGIAVSINDTRMISLLMASGAPLEDHEESDEPLTIWDLALPGERVSSTAADLLTSGAPASIDPNDIETYTAVLEMIVKNATKPPILASRGIFTSLLVRYIDRLQELSEREQWTARKQCVLAAAFNLKESLVKLRIVRDSATSDASSRDAIWFEDTRLHIQSQRSALLEGSGKLIAHCMESLHATTTLEFFLGCSADCPESESMASFIKHRIAETTGAPDAVVRVVRDAWINAAKWTKDWQVSPNAAEEGNRFLLALARNLIFKALDDFVGDLDSVSAACLDALRKTLPASSLEINKFCADPAAWLRRFENRNTLDDPADTLADQVQIALGLPAATCEAIVTEWRNALRTARTARWNSPAELQFVLKRAMAINIGRALHAGEADQIISPVARLMLEETRSSVSAQVPAQAPVQAPAQTPSRKRPAEDEAPDAPPRKSARDSETS